MKRYRIKLSWHVEGLEHPVESDFEVHGHNPVAAIMDAVWNRLKQESKTFDGNADDSLVAAIGQLEKGVKIELVAL